MSLDPHGAELQMSGAVAGMAVPGAVLTVAGLAAACGLALCSSQPGGLFLHAYLVAYAFFLSITLGGLFFVMLHHLARAGWSVTLRRLAEALAGNIGLMGVLAIPLLVGMGEIYPWASLEDWSRRAGVAPVTVRDASASGSEVTVTFIGPLPVYYLSPPAFIARLVAYFLILGGLVWYLRSRSIRQDADGDPRWSRRMEWVSTPGMILLALVASFASFDLLMGLQPNWSSTIFGVYFFIGSVLAGLVTLVLLARWLQARGRLGPSVSIEHYHDLGKLAFAFVFFWGYIAFGQYLLIWYANMPEETQFYMVRQIGPWAWVSIALVVFQLLIPFLGLLSRHAKRNLKVLSFWAVWLLAAHLFDLYWIVMPNLYVRQMPAAVGAPPGTPLRKVLAELLASNQSVYELAPKYAQFMSNVAAPLQPLSVAVVLALVAGMGGLYLMSTARLLAGAALVPVGDPRLDESLAFENT
jgi:hypothetical protein